MPTFGVNVRTWDEGGFEIEAEDLEEAEELVAGMERDDLESRTEWTDGGYEAEVEAGDEPDEPDAPDEDEPDEDEEDLNLRLIPKGSVQFEHTLCCPQCDTEVNVRVHISRLDDGRTGRASRNRRVA